MTLSQSVTQILWRGMLALSLLSGASVSFAAGTSFYVSPTGNDQNAGTQAKPWKSIQKAANTATPGSTVHVLAGLYAEQVTVGVSGNAALGPITFLGQSAVLDFASRPIKTGDTGAFHIDGKSYLKISGFEIRNYIAKAAAAVPVGIHVRGAAHHIELSGNLIHHITNNINASSNAHGIAVYGTGRTAATAIHDLLIANNELHSLKLGASESLVVNGNVDGFTIQGNSVHDCNNIAIDAIGFEGTSIAPLDQTRNGVIARNTIARIDSRGNPAYGQDRSADGIYVDGGKSIRIDANSVTLCNIGIEVASEHKGVYSSEVTVINNTVTSCHTVGLSLGGYDTRRGGTRNCLIQQNTLRGNDTDAHGSGELQLQYQVSGNIIQNNIFSSTNQNVFISNPFKTTMGNIVDNNTYSSPGGANGSTWTWNNIEYNDFATYKRSTGNDAHSLFR